MICDEELPGVWSGETANARCREYAAAILAGNFPAGLRSFAQQEYQAGQWSDETANERCRAYARALASSCA